MTINCPWYFQSSTKQTLTNNRKQRMEYTWTTAALCTSEVHWHSKAIYFSQGNCLLTGKMGIFCWLPDNKFGECVHL